VGLRAAPVVRLEGALAHLGLQYIFQSSGKRRSPDQRGESTGCHRAPTRSLRAWCVVYVQPQPLWLQLTRSCPSEAGGGSRRQLDRATVRARRPRGQTAA
jgi:hypothetical protein